MFQKKNKEMGGAVGNTGIGDYKSRVYMVIKPNAWAYHVQDLS